MAYQSERDEAAIRPHTSAVGHIAVTQASAAHFDGVFKELTLEHAQMLTLLLEAQESTDLEERGALVDRLAEALISHEEAERSALYMTLRDRPSLASYVDAHALDAERLQRVVHQLQSIPPHDESWRGTLDQLIEMLQQHTRQEETDYFLVAQKLVGDEPALLDAYQRAKASILSDLESE